MAMKDVGCRGTADSPAERAKRAGVYSEAERERQSRCEVVEDRLVGTRDETW